MTYDVLILSASHGSLFGTTLLMAGHRVSLVCTKPTADLIKDERLGKNRSAGTR